MFWVSSWGHPSPQEAPKIKKQTTNSTTIGSDKQSVLENTKEGFRGWGAGRGQRTLPGSHFKLDLRKSSSLRKTRNRPKDRSAFLVYSTVIQGDWITGHVHCIDKKSRLWGILKIDYKWALNAMPRDFAFAARGKVSGSFARQWVTWDEEKLSQRLFTFFCHESFWQSGQACGPFSK